MKHFFLSVCFLLLHVRACFESAPPLSAFPCSTRNVYHCCVPCSKETTTTVNELPQCGALAASRYKITHQHTPTRREALQKDFLFPISSHEPLCHSFQNSCNFTAALLITEIVRTPHIYAQRTTLVSAVYADILGPPDNFFLLYLKKKKKKGARHRRLTGLNSFERILIYRCIGEAL
jgi:hypothetical protein